MQCVPLLPTGPSQPSAALSVDREPWSRPDLERGHFEVTPLLWKAPPLAAMEAPESAGGQVLDLNLGHWGEHISRRSSDHSSSCGRGMS